MCRTQRRHSLVLVWTLERFFRFFVCTVPCFSHLVDTGRLENGGGTGLKNAFLFFLATFLFGPYFSPASLARTGLGKMVPAAKPLSLETEHPYANNADWKETVRIEGAKKLIVTFDDRSRRAWCLFLFGSTVEGVEKKKKKLRVVECSTDRSARMFFGPRTIFWCRQICCNLFDILPQ